ncbi:MAG: NADH-quinone oxidoreductase subunit L [Bacteroidota bacterium]|nr:NADH-quinone oxidoreductase subunit L [Bacteroidota bacterium]
MTQEFLLQLSLAVLLLPLLSFVVIIFFGKRLQRQGDLVGTSVLGVGLLSSLVILFTKLNYFNNVVPSFTFTWVDFHTLIPLKLDIGIMIDNVTAVMLVVVTLISFLVHVFSTVYMHDDIRYSRYYAYLSFFSFSMLGIVLANNFWLIYVFWELVGISSYLLIGHWYEKKSAADAGKKAFIVNRVGDLGMFIGIMIVWANFHTLTFDGIFSAIAAGQIPFQSDAWMTAAGILIFCGAIGKSAQFPLHVWLPDAMEGPTPVSALIHAATMVAAGVYLVARVFPMLTADALTFIAYIGAVTAFMAATIALAQNDIKKVLAYSTVSQLGYMVMGLGVGAYTAGFFHLATHAAFKAGLFLGSGSVIYAMHNALHHQNDHHTDAQDIRNMGGLRKKMPVTFWTFVMFTLAISGVPFTSGFLSKDQILAGTLAFSDLTGHSLIPILGFGAAALTAFYMFRLVILAFLGEHKDPSRLEHLHESPKPMIIPLIVLASLSFFVFYSFNPLAPENGWFYHAIERPATVVPANLAAASPEVFEETIHHEHTTAMYLSLTVASLGILFAFLTYYWKKISADAFASALAPVHKFLLNKWYFDELYHATAVAGTIGFSRLLAWFDNTFVDGIVNGTARWTLALTLGVKRNWEVEDQAKGMEGKREAVVYLFFAALLSVYVGWAAGSAAWHGAGMGAAVGKGIIALIVAGGTFFLLHAGVGGFDNKVVDGTVNLTAYLAGFFGLMLRKIQTGRVQSYILFVLIGVMVFFFLFKL